MLTKTMLTKKITAIHNQEQIRVQSGTIDTLIDEGYRIATPKGHVTAQRAFSCIVEPRLNDVVLFSTDERMQGHILSILERQLDKSTCLNFPADVTVKVQKGELHMNARQGLYLSTEQDMNLLSKKLSVNAEKGLMNIKSLNAIGSTLVSKIRNVQTFAHSLETVAEHWLQKLKNSFRQVEGVDQLKTRDSLHTIDNLYSMRSKQAAILAKKDIKMDAERIHMG